MAEVALAGDEVELPAFKLSYTFKIRNFDKMMETGREELKVSSPPFGHPDTPGVRWQIGVHPLGLHSPGHVSVFLELSGEKPMAKFALRSGSRVVEGKVGDASDGGYGEHHFLAHGDVEYAEPGVFAVTATVDCVWGEIKAASLPLPPPMAPDHSELLFSRELVDFSLEVEGETIPVHKVLLASASPVFRAMFAQTGTREAASNSAVLKDTSLGAVKRLLRFVYTGRLDLEAAEEAAEETAVAKKEEGAEAGAAEANAGDQDEAKAEGGEDKLPVRQPKSSAYKQETEELCGVLGLAHCYDVAGLGEAAEAVLQSRVDEDSVVPIAAAADLHGYPRLLKLCRKFLGERERKKKGLKEAVLSGRVALVGVEELLRDRPALVCKLTSPAHFLP